MQSADQPVTAYGVRSVMAGGGISLTRKTPHVHIAGNLPAQRYVDEVLRPHVAPLAAAHGGALVYIYDINARPHRGRVATACLVGKGIKRKVWPASSPDLNHIPVGLAEAICISTHQSNSSNLAHLSHLLQVQWNAIPQQRVTRLINTMTMEVDLHAMTVPGGH